MTVTVELLSADALDLLKNLEKLSILKVKKSKSTAVKSKKDITKLYGKLKLDMSVDEIDSQLKNLRNEWERDFS